MRKIENINQDIERCQAQIAGTYNDDFMYKHKDYLIVREGFQRKLKFLFNEKSMLDLQNPHNCGVKNITVNAARIVTPSGADIPYTKEDFKTRAILTIHRTIQELQRNQAGL